MARRDSGVEGQIELALATTLAPLAAKIADRLVPRTHRPRIAPQKGGVQLPPR